MSGIAAATPAIVQDIRAQAVASLMAAIDGAVAAAAGVPKAAVGQGRQADTVSAQAAPNATVTAEVIESPRGARILVAIAGQPVALDLSPTLQRLVAREPALLAAGAPVELRLNPAGTRIIALALRPVAPMPTATIRSISASSPPDAGSVDAAPQLASPFPVGSVGAAIARLSGIPFPVAERAATPSATPGMIAPPAQASVLNGRPALSIPTPAANPTLANSVDLPLPALASLPAGVAEAALRASIQQGPLGPAITALLTGEMQPDIAIPTEILRNLRLDVTRPVSPEALRDAVRQSGTFLEATIAQTAKSGIQSDTPIPADLKSTLLAIKALISAVPAGAVVSPGQNASANAPPPAAAKPLAPVLAPGQGAPSREAAPSAAPELLRLVEGAIERIKLTQMASLPDHPEMQITDDRGQGMRLALTLPVATQGLERPHTAMIGLVIEHQPQPGQPEFEVPDPGTGEANQPFPWKVRIAVDLDETGPVQAEIGLRGQAIAITLWAERKAMAGLARAEIGTLHQALTDAAFDVTRLEVKDGRPQGSAPARLAPLLDRRS